MTRLQRAWVTVVLVLLVVPGAIGFELWPMTGWRLFSAARDEVQVVWVLDADGRRVDLEALPLAFRNAAWILDQLPGAGERRRLEVCEALLREIGGTELRIGRARQELVERGGEWVTTERVTPFATCRGATVRREAG